MIAEKQHYTKSHLQGRTVDRLRIVVEYVSKYGSLPITADKRVPQRTIGAEYGETRKWLRDCIRNHKDAETSPLRAAIVKIGALAPRGDEWKYEEVLPDFLKSFDTAEPGMARKPRAESRTLSPDPFALKRPSGGHTGSPFSG